MFLFGLVENIKSVSFPLIKTEFGVPYDSQGGLVSMTWFGYVIFSLVASLFMLRFGIKRSILAGYMLVCSGAVATTGRAYLLAGGPVTPGGQCRVWLLRGRHQRTRDGRLHPPRRLDDESDAFFLRLWRHHRPQDRRVVHRTFSD